MDILLEWSPALFSGDWAIAGGSVAISQTGSDDLKTAVLVSLFTDGLAPVDYVGPNGDTDPRGWWADTYEQSTIGSKLWLLARAKKTDQTTVPAQARTYCLEALQWLLDDGIASAVNVTTFWLRPTAGTLALGITVSIVKPSGQQNGYSWLWQGF